MKACRWLLPFTHGVDCRAIELAVRLAAEQGVTLVPVCMVLCSDKPRSAGVRLEYIQQSKDFLEVVYATAQRCQLPVEGHEVFTSQVIPCITQLVQDLHCDSIVIVTQMRQGVLLSTDELTAILTHPPAPLVLVRMVESQKNGGIFHRRIWPWLQQFWQQGNNGRQKERPAVLKGGDSASEAQRQAG